MVTLLYDPTGDVNLRDQVQGVIKGATISISLEKQVMQGQQDMEDLTSIASDDSPGCCRQRGRKNRPTKI